MTLHQELEYYIANQQKLVEKYNGKCIVIKDQIVIGEYTDELEAIEETSKKYELGTFMVQKCEPGIWGYTAVFSSDRVSFS